MKGHIRKRGDAWELRVYVGVDAVTGKKRYATKSIRGGNRDAERALVEFAADAQRGKLSRTNTTVAELLDAWFDQASQDFSPKTVVETRGFIDRNLMPALGTVPLTRLKAADLDRYYTRLLKNGGQAGQPLSPATIRRIHGILRRALQQAVRWGWIGANPAASASPPRVNAPEIRPPRPDEVAEVFRAVGDDPEFAAYLMLSAISGARRSEVIALRWTDIDIEHASMTIRRAIVVGPNGLVEKDTKTHSVRRVALDARTVQMLAGYCDYIHTRADQCRVEHRPDCLVFATDVEMLTLCYPDSVSRRFRRACERAGVEGVRLHDLRHDVATRLPGSPIVTTSCDGRGTPSRTLTVEKPQVRFDARPFRPRRLESSSPMSGRGGTSIRLRPPDRRRSNAEASRPRRLNRRLSFLLACQLVAEADELVDSAGHAVVIRQRDGVVHEFPPIAVGEA